jgi:hypothetical protein
METFHALTELPEWDIKGALMLGTVQGEVR